MCVLLFKESTFQMSSFYVLNRKCRVSLTRNIIYTYFFVMEVQDECIESYNR